MPEKKKVIFITIKYGMIVRNLLNNDFFQLLKQKYNIVIFTSNFNDPEFINKFGGENVKFEELKTHESGRLEKLIIALHKGLIYNQTVKIRTRYGFSTKHSESRKWTKPIVYYFQHIVFGLFLSRFKFLRNWLKILDRIIFAADYYNDLFTKYKPVAVFVTHIQLVDEVYLLKSAIKHKVYCFGMTKSWDNFSQNGFRVWVDKFIVWSDFMKLEAMKFQNYEAVKLSVVGIPQFDIYNKITKNFGRDDFINVYGLNKNKKIILFGQESTFLSPDDPFIVELIKNWVIQNNKNYQMLIRPHFKHKNQAEVFEKLVDNEVVFIDTKNNPSKFPDGWDLSQEHQLRLALSLRFCDVVITSVSTLILDALASNTPVICYAFDKDENKDYQDSIKRLFETLWFIELKNNGLERFKVNNKSELFYRLEEILESDKYVMPKEQRKIVNYFCYKIDGNSGRRLFESIDNEIAKINNK